ncbi:MAG: precorrin-2 C(20)-methyltransferase [Oscillospiraceae bacterium]|nr:precorrin-2 C(20)-methyltransferase [Oscillospiraceae bacterium]
MEKKALLAVSFGTSHNDTREKTIDCIEAQLGKTLPDRQVYRAFTSKMIVKKLRARDGAEIDTVAEAMERMLRDGVTDVLVQPTHLLNGTENDAMRWDAESFRARFQELRFASPLLTTDADLRRMVGIMKDEFQNLGEEEAVIFMGHGTEHYADAVYAALDYRFKAEGCPRFFMATVEGYPTIEDALQQLGQLGGIRTVCLAPFMIVAGEHAKNDMAGDEADSWKNLVTRAGYECRCLSRGLGEFSAVREMLCDHARTADGRIAPGKLYGIGVGPGDPELLTIKALRRIRECDLLALPDSDRGGCAAYRIAEQAWPGIQGKPAVSVLMPMTHDKVLLEKSHRAAADLLETHLAAGKTIGFLTLGDPTVYSTYFYVHRLVAADGFETEIIPGVPSFCAAAARLGESLGERAEMIHIVPSSHGVEEALKLPGVKILMKAGSKLGAVRQVLLQSGAEANMVENCGMEQEKIYRGAAEIPADAGYFSLILVRDRRKLK